MADALKNLEQSLKVTLLLLYPSGIPKFCFHSQFNSRIGPNTSDKRMPSGLSHHKISIFGSVSNLLNMR